MQIVAQHCSNTLNQDITVGFHPSLFLAKSSTARLFQDVVSSCRIEPASAPAYIKKHAELFQKLPRAFESISTIKQMHNIRISDISSNTLDQALVISKKYSLLLNDALHIAVMREQEINCIATYDRDFERVPGIMVTKP